MVLNDEFQTTDSWISFFLAVLKEPNGIDLPKYA